VFNQSQGQGWERGRGGVTLFEGSVLCGKVIVGVFFFLFLFLFLSNKCLIRVRVKDGKGEAAREVSQWTLGAGGVHREYFHIPAGMVVRGGKR